MNKQEMINEIKRLKREKNAVILAHYYQEPDIQDVADFIGDSLDLSRVAASVESKIIVFCGVHFMAETAKILSPDKKVLLPDLNAGCPMADMVTAPKLRNYLEEHPDTKVICYVNSTAEIKAMSTVCVTSTNAKKIVERFVGEKLIYVPDKNLGRYLNEQVPGLNMDLWPGHCCIHDDLMPVQVEEMRALHPNAKFIVHPEANKDVVDLADFAGSTKQLLNYTISDESEEFIVGTEGGVIHQMQIASPNKKFYLLTPKLRCKTMRLNTLEKLYETLRDEKNEIFVEKEVSLKAKKALDLMLELS